MVSAVVVENHSHALYYIHKNLRSQKLAGNRWQMIHFDAHADLACPGSHIPAVACFRPNDAVVSDVLNRKESVLGDDEGEGCNLYELLDATASGIAEWIVPLALAGNLYLIQWVRPATSTKASPSIPTGEHKFCVGVCTDNATEDCAHFIDLPDNSAVKVDSPLLYYLEDGAYAPSTDLVLPQTLHLRVWDAGVHGFAVPLLLDSAEMPFLLDICLDFFFCVNPFLADLEDLNEPAAGVLVDAISSSSLYDGSSSSLQTPEDTRAMVQQFRANFALVLNSIVTKPTTCCDSAQFRQHFLTHLRGYYRAEQEAIRIANALYESVVPVDTNFVSLAIEALPYLLLPHDDLASQKSIIEERLDVFRGGLRQLLSRRQQQPFLITLARSAEDGFIPKQVADSLQSTVLQMIGEEMECELDVHLDYEPES